MSVDRVVVIGGSTGALEALLKLVRAWKPGPDVAVCVVIHTAPSAPGLLDGIISRNGAVPAQYAVDGESLRAGEIHIAPPDRHLVVSDAHVRVTRGPRESRFRPAIDPLFRSAAESYGSRAIGIILSGGQSDGAAGLYEIKQKGGIAIVQSPSEAPVRSLPDAAIRAAAVDRVVPIADLPALLNDLVASPLPKKEASMEHQDSMEPPESKSPEAETHEIHHAESLGEPTPFTCPDCGGTLWQSPTGELLQFRCHVGHRYAEDALKDAQDDSLEQALWTALRALEESSELRRRMSRHAREHGMTVIAGSYSQQAQESERRAALIRQILLSNGSRKEPSNEPPVPVE